MCGRSEGWIQGGRVITSEDRQCSPFSFGGVMDRLRDEVRQESMWTIMFVDNIVISSEGRELVEEVWTQS